VPVCDSRPLPEVSRCVAVEEYRSEPVYTLRLICCFRAFTGDTTDIMNVRYVILPDAGLKL